MRYSGKLKGFTAFMLALLIALSLAFPAGASGDNRTALGTTPLNYQTAAATGLNTAVEERRAEIEQRYGIRIRYDVDHDGTAAIGTGALNTLDVVLGYITPGVVRQLSDYWEARTGQRIQFSFVYSPFQRYASIIGGEVLGSFNPGSAVIELYIPSFGADVFISGESPLTILHELGHAFHFMAMDHFGEDEMRELWEAFNGDDFEYTTNIESSDFDPFVFVSEYSQYSFEEDFAETFAHAFIRHKPGQGFANYLTLPEGGLSALGRKVNFIERLLPLYLDDTEQMVANYRRVWQTPVVLEHSGLRLLGAHTQYIGFTHPRFVLTSLAGKLGLEMESNVWVSEIGGWIVIDTNGMRYAVFPGGIAFILRDD
ncbi:MAG: hypothetical protein FWE32_04000 [Oscillospiraceae bacterium]|nr:hypothetical protein [Oscillospiraceae bacterium]